MGEPIVLHAPFSKVSNKIQKFGGNPSATGKTTDDVDANLKEPVVPLEYRDLPLEYRDVGVTKQQAILPRNSSTVSARAYIGRHARPFHGGRPHNRAPHAAGDGAWFYFRVAETGKRTRHFHVSHCRWSLTEGLVLNKKTNADNRSTCRLASWSSGRLAAATSSSVDLERELLVLYAVLGDDLDVDKVASVDVALARGGEYVFDQLQRLIQSPLVQRLLVRVLVGHHVVKEGLDQRLARSRYSVLHLLEAPHGIVAVHDALPSRVQSAHNVECVKRKESSLIERCCEHLAHCRRRHLLAVLMHVHLLPTDMSARERRGRAQAETPQGQAAMTLAARRSDSSLTDTCKRNLRCF